MKTILLLLFIVVTSAVGINAQNSRRDAAAIKYARELPVSRIESGVSTKRFEAWLLSLIGPGAKVAWEINDCGEQTGTPADRGRDFPMCAEVSLEKDELDLYVSLAIGTFKRGIRGKPQVRSVSLLMDDVGVGSSKLSDLKKEILEYRQALKTYREIKALD